MKKILTLAKILLFIALVILLIDIYRYRDSWWDPMLGYLLIIGVCLLYLVIFGFLPAKSGNGMNIRFWDLFFRLAAASFLMITVFVALEYTPTDFTLFFSFCIILILYAIIQVEFIGKRFSRLFTLRRDKP